MAWEYSVSGLTLGSDGRILPTILSPFGSELRHCNRVRVVQGFVNKEFHRVAGDSSINMPINQVEALWFDRVVIDLAHVSRDRGRKLTEYARRIVSIRLIPFNYIFA